MKTIHVFKTAATLVLLVAVSPQTMAQKASPTANKPQEIQLKEDTAAKVGRLLQERDALQEQVVGWQNTLDSVKEKLEGQQAVQKELEQKTAELADIKKKPNP